MTSAKAMIIVNLIGGLGNQMFQYACGRALAADLALPLKVTHDMFGTFEIHNGPELTHAFALSLDVAEPSELGRMIGTLRTPPKVRLLLGRPSWALLAGRRFLAEPHFGYWDGLRGRARAGGYLQGYWQSERYFAGHEDVIRKDFVFREAMTGSNAELEKIILKSDSVAVHVRRGDYADDPKTSSVHGVCSPEYYFAAIDAMRKRIPEPTILAFSDDPRWVTEVLASRYPDLVVVTHNRGEHSYNDMRLMSLCKHNIIGNSSFSWWAAWLNDNPAKIVIAPCRWFEKDIDTRDLLPDRWELM